MPWTEERVELLKKLWQDGLSASQIAAELGGVTRNAVIGKVHRLGLSGRGQPTTSIKRQRRAPAQAARQARPAITVGNLIFCSMLGYALAKLRFPGKRMIFLLVMGTLMVPGVVTFVPLFVLVSNLGMTNSFAGLIFPFLAGPFGVFLMRQFILGLPDELIHAARVDGAGEFRIFWSIIMPLCKPVLATLGILTFLASWNNFLWPLVVAQSEDKYTLPVALAIYSIGEKKADYGLLMAGSVVVVIPVLLVFLALQKHFVRGIAMTGIK